MDQSYSVLSKVRKPRITQAEFLDYYQFKETEIQHCALTEFLDYFTVSKDDLALRSREEVVFTLLGFALDRAAEKAAEPVAAGLNGVDIGEAVFEDVSGLGEGKSRVDFVGGQLFHEGRTCGFAPADRAVLVQALADLRYPEGLEAREAPGGPVCRLTVTDVRGGSFRAEVPAARLEILRKIFDAIAARQD